MYMYMYMYIPKLHCCHRKFILLVKLKPCHVYATTVDANFGCVFVSGDLQSASRNISKNNQDDEMLSLREVKFPGLRCSYFVRIVLSE